TGQAAGNTVSSAAPMAPAAVKTSANGAALSVLNTGSFHAPGTIQWQRFDTGSQAWVDIAGQNATTLTYASFLADDPNPTAYSDTTDGSPYMGKVYHVQVRIKTTRTLNGLTCFAVSDPVVIKMLVAVDP